MVSLSDSQMQIWERLERVRNFTDFVRSEFENIFKLLSFGLSTFQLIDVMLLTTVILPEAKVQVQSSLWTDMKSVFFRFQLR